MFSGLHLRHWIWKDMGVGRRGASLSSHLLELQTLNYTESWTFCLQEAPGEGHSGKYYMGGSRGVHLLPSLMELLSHLLKLELEGAKLFFGERGFEQQTRSCSLQNSLPKHPFLYDSRQFHLGSQPWENRYNPHFTKHRFPFEDLWHIYVNRPPARRRQEGPEMRLTVAPPFQTWTLVQNLQGLSYHPS